MNIRQVFIEDNGMYACIANNTAGVARWDFYLRVTSKTTSTDHVFLILMPFPLRRLMVVLLLSSVGGE